MRSGWPNVHVVALGVHALEPCGGLLHLGAAPFPVHHLAGLGFADSHLETGHVQRVYLPLDGFKASITAGFKWSATAFASSWFCTVTVGGASQSQNPLTSAAVTSPVNRARA